MAGTNKKSAVANGKNHAKNGRFTKGNDAGGNHYAGYISKLRAALYESVTEEDIKKIAQAQIRKAQASTDAAKFVFEYLIGKPAQNINLESDGAVFEIIVSERKAKN